jgi:hypothetical protein
MNLETLFPNYRIDYECDYPHGTPGYTVALQIIPGGGTDHIYVHSRELLAASVATRAVARRLLKIGCRMYQDSDNDGYTLLFPKTLLPEVAKVIRARRRVRRAG